MLDLGLSARTVLAVVWIGAQAALVISAKNRPDAAFGFRMFPESSTISASLAREIDAPSGHGTVTVKVNGGAWTAHDAHGVTHRFSWHDRVHEPALATFDRTMFASYGVAAQTARFQGALDDVARHIPEDAETRALVLTLTTNRNGHEPHEARLVHAIGR